MKMLLPFISIISGIFLYANAFAQTNGKLVTLNGFAFQISNNAVYGNKLGGSEVVKLNGSDGMIDSLAVFRGQLFALEGSQRGFLAGLFKGRGTVYVFQNNSWVAIDFGNAQLLATKDNLVSLSKAGELWIFKGKVEQPTSGSYVTLTTVNPSTGAVSDSIAYNSGNQTSSFFFSGINGVARISPVEKGGEVVDVEIHLNNGSVDFLSRLKSRTIWGVQQ